MTAARCDTRPVYGSAEGAARLLEAGEESWAVWWERPFKDRFMDRLLLLANVVNDYKQ